MARAGWVVLAAAAGWLIVIAANHPVVSATVLLAAWAWAGWASRSWAPIAATAALSVPTVISMVLIHGPYGSEPWLGVLSRDGLALAAALTLRFAALMACVLLIMAVLSVTEIAQWIQQSVAGYKVAYIVGSALQMIPHSAAEVRSIREANYLDGVRLSVRTIIPRAIIPLISRLIVHGTERGAALVAIGFDEPGPRTLLDPEGKFAADPQAATAVVRRWAAGPAPAAADAPVTEQSGSIIYRTIPAEQRFEDYARQWGSTALVSADASVHISRLRATVIEEIAMGLEHQGLAPELIEQRAGAMLAALDLAEVAGADPARLSGGQTRRLAIGCVAITEPDTLILCEPFAGLDPHSSAAVHTVISALAARGTTVVVLSYAAHSMMSFPEPVAPQPGPAVELSGVQAQRGGQQRRWWQRRRNDAPFNVGPIDLTVRPGTVLWLRGPNGSGKTSILRAIAGLERLAPRQPEALTVSMALQSPVEQYSGAPVAPGQAHPMDLSLSQLRVQQIAQVIDQQRQLVLLDEPDSLLAPEHRGAVHELIAQGLRRGAAIVLTTHDPGFAEEISRYAQLSDYQLAPAS